MAAINVDDLSFDSEVLRADRLVVVDFWAEWCPWCKRLMPVFEETAVEYEGKLKFAKVNVDVSVAVPQRFAVMSLPTLKFFLQGRIVGELVGYMTKTKLKAEIDKILAAHTKCLESGSQVRMKGVV